MPAGAATARMARRLAVPLVAFVLASTALAQAAPAQADQAAGSGHSGDHHATHRVVHRHGTHPAKARRHGHVGRARPAHARALSPALAAANGVQGRSAHKHAEHGKAAHGHRIDKRAAQAAAKRARAAAQRGRATGKPTPAGTLEPAALRAGGPVRTVSISTGLSPALAIDSGVRALGRTGVGGAAAPARTHTSHRSAHRAAAGGAVAVAPVLSPALQDLSAPVVAPLRRLGHTIADITGWSIFDGPLGWVLTGMLLVALAMIGLALSLGRRRIV